MVKLKSKKKENKSEEFYDKVLKSKNITNWISGKGKRRIATGLLYERIGNSEKFLGGYPLLKGTFNIGEYLVLDYKKPYFLDALGSEAFTPCQDQKLGKIVELVKYSEDDIRVRQRLDQTFYKRKKVPLTEEKTLIENNEIITDDNGKPIIIQVPKRNKEGQIMYETIEEFYEEPKGVTQEGRDAIRIHNDTNEEIKKFKEKNKGFMEKYATVIVPIVGMAIVAMLFLMGMKYTSDAWIEGVQSLTGEIKDASNNLQWWQQTDALDKIGSAIQKKQDEKNAPPVT